MSIGVQDKRVHREGLSGMQELAREIIRIHDRQYVDVQSESLLITMHYPGTCGRQYCVVPVTSFPDPMRLWLQYTRSHVVRGEDWVVRGDLDRMPSSLFGLTKMLLGIRADDFEFSFVLDHLDSTTSSAEAVETYLDNWFAVNGHKDESANSSEISLQISIHYQLGFMGFKLEEMTFMLWHEKFFVPIFEFFKDVLSDWDTFPTLNRLPAVVARFQVDVEMDGNVNGEMDGEMDGEVDGEVDGEAGGAAVDAL